MYTYFNRFLHHTLSHSDEKPQSTPMLSYSGLTRISRWVKFANWFDLDTPVKPECDSMRTNAATCRGRSMVEMLGVLAIIGILSVGAIAGYSKAMIKYKLNKQAEQISWLLNVMYRYKDLLGQDKQWTSFVPYFKKLGEIPQEMIKDNSDNIYDSFGINYVIITNGCSPTCLYADMSIEMSNDYKNFDICNNILETSKPFADQLNNVTIWESESNIGLAGLAGNAVCGSNHDKCLKDITKNDIYDICRLCADKGCSFNFQYKIKD